MKVNMTPNPLDVVTIHASQGDTEARQWEFELHNNGELIDTSEITEQLFFKSYKGGTEQLLPENTSTPTTSPFKGDIRYPQGLLTDQEFTYRESPTEEDGLAKITDIKGNTLVWNQLVQNGNFADTTGWSLSDSVSLSVANNILTATIGTAHHSSIRLIKTDYLMVSGKKYLFMCDVKASKNTSVRFQYDGVATGITTQTMIANVWNRYASFATMTANNLTTLYYNVGNNLTEGDTVQFRNCVLFDLSLMGLDITDPSEFTSLFPLSYYSYNQGSLLSFNGNGIKTVGFNQWDEEWEAGSYSSVGGKVPTSGGRIRSVNKIPVLPNTTYYMSKGVNILCQYDANKSFISFMQLGVDSPSNVPHTVSLGANTHYIAFATYAQYGTTYKNDICINMSDAERNGTYEPYTSSTLSLPISTYFPTGMKSAGNVYDELTESKAITRIGAVDLGTLTWSYDSTHALFYSTQLRDSVDVDYTSMPNIICASYTTVRGIGYNSGVDKSISINYIYGPKKVTIKDTSYTDATTFKTAISGVYLYYELATPTETSFTTASLVTENAEIPLSNEDGVLIGKCTEELSAEPGFHDAKIKLADGDGTCYSNKIQLHVERSPQ